MKTRGFLLVAIVLVAVLGLVVLGGCSKEQPVKEQISVVNITCPIMGNEIDPEKITADLVREYKGEKVAFCCAGCPDKWDALSDEDKVAKLAAVK